MASPLGPGPLVYGHRGAAAHAPENTIAAFLLALEQGAAGVEFDVRRSRDGALIVHHDDRHPAVGRFADRDLAEIRDALPDLPTLEEVLDAVPGFLDVEIKNDIFEAGFDRRRRIVDQVVAALRRAGVVSRCLVSSFDPLTVRRVRELAPELLTGQLLTEWIDPLEVLPWIARDGHDALHLPHSRLEADRASRVVAAAAARGLAVVAWTVDDPAEARRLADAGVTAVITNDPAAIVPALA